MARRLENLGSFRKGDQALVQEGGLWGLKIRVFDVKVVHLHPGIVNLIYLFHRVQILHSRSSCTKAELAVFRPRSHFELRKHVAGFMTEGMYSRSHHAITVNVN